MVRAPHVVVAVALAATFAGGCRKKAPSAPAKPPAPTEPAATVPRGPLVGPEFRFALGVYHLKRPPQPPASVVARLVRMQSVLTLATTPPDGPPEKPILAVLRPPLAELPPPSAETLGHFGRGLSPQQIAGLAAADSVSALMFVGPGKQALSAYRQARVVAGTLAAEASGLIWDEEARLMYTPEAWARAGAGWSADGLPDMRQHISIHAYREGELIRMRTLGMRKFALPDVVVNQVASGHGTMNTVINLLCQRLVEGAVLEQDGMFTLALDEIRHPVVRGSIAVSADARRRATLRLQPAEPAQGDPENGLLEIVSPGPSSSVQERHAALLKELLGTGPAPRRDAARQGD